VPSRYVYRLLDTVGDGTGTKNATGDYSTPQAFRISAPSGGLYMIERMIVHIRDAQALSADNYGNLAELTTGVSVKVYNGDTEDVDLTDGEPIKNHADWDGQCYDGKTTDFGSGNNFYTVRWTFSKAGQPLYLHGDWNLRVELADNLTGLIKHQFRVQGVYSRSTSPALPRLYKA